MTKTQDRQAYLDVAKDMGMLGVVASHCLVETSLGILSDWYGFFILAVFYVYTGWRYALRYRKGRIGIFSREMAGERFISLGVPYVCYSVLLIFSRIFLVRPQRYTFLVLMSDIYYTGTLVGLETLWFLPSIFIAELLLNMMYDSRRKVGIGARLTGATNVFLILYINGSRRDTTLWRVIHLPFMVYIKGLISFLLALGDVFARDVWQKASLYLKSKAGLAAASLLMCSGIAFTVLISGCDFNFLAMESPVPWILTAWFSSVIILMFGKRVSACGDSWKEWSVLGRVLMPSFTYYEAHPLTTICTHLVLVVALFRVVADGVICPGVLSNTPWDVLFLTLALAVGPGVVWLVGARLLWVNEGRRHSR